MKKLFWAFWLLLTLAVGSYFLYITLAAEDKSTLLIGAASHGHYQIEMACGACHTDAFGGGAMIQNACVNCHQEELKQSHDSHPKKKFNDPRNADLLANIDVTQCVTCHTEHKPDQTHAMGVTLPEDFCYECHKDIGNQRSSHKDLTFDSCASAGCHNYHDNRALYEKFLVSNADGDWLQAIAALPPANHARLQGAPHPSSQALASPATTTTLDQQKKTLHPQATTEWLASTHGQAGISCSGCHVNKDEPEQWLDKPDLNECKTCHQQEAAGFLSGKHGMRLAASLPAMQPALSAMEFKENTKHEQLGCTSCHGAHSFDTQQATFSACVACHDDQHSRAFIDSPHGQLTSSALKGDKPWENAVTCATCHMPRLFDEKNSAKELSIDNSGIKVDSNSEESGGSSSGQIVKVSVEHNQNATLRPNEKMIRPVCMRCHSLEFSIDALASPELIENNFNGSPSAHIPAIDWALQRAK